MPINNGCIIGMVGFTYVSKIKFTESSVSTILLSCFGGHASLYKVKQLQNWSFKFSTSSKEVGYSIIKGGNIAIPEFNINFLLFGEGGPNSNVELDLYLQEKADEWTHIFRNHPRKSYAQVLRSPAIYPNRGESDHRSRTINHSQLTDESPGQRDQRMLSSGHNHGEGSPPIQTVPHGPPPAHNLYCVRCLQSGHLRPNCSNRIKCHRCKHWGHIAKDCYSKPSPSKQAQPISSPRPNFSPPRNGSTRQVSTVPALTGNQPTVSATTLATAPPVSSLSSYYGRWTPDTSPTYL